MEMLKQPRPLTKADAPKVVVTCKVCGEKVNPESPELLQCHCGARAKVSDPFKRAAYGDCAHNLVKGLKDAIEATDEDKEQFPFKIWLQYPDQIEPEQPERNNPTDEGAEKLGMKPPKNPVR
jgi:hypothetical protein